MKFLIIYKFKPEIDLNDFFITTGKQESAASWNLYKAGVFEELYICTHAPVAIVVMEAIDKDFAEKTAHSLPAYQKKMLDCELIPIGPYMNFKLLFDKTAV